MKIKPMLCIWSLWLLGLACYGQAGRLFSGDGKLSSSLVNQVFCDRNGVVWIATENGLNRYDGAKFTIFRHGEGNPGSLMNDCVRVLFEDSRGRFFVGTQAGLQLYDPGTETFAGIPMTFPEGNRLSVNIASLLERNNGEILAGTSGHGLFRIEDGAAGFRAVQSADMVPSYLIGCLYESRDGNLWVATEDKGLFRLDGINGPKRYFGEREMLRNPVSDLCEDAQGTLYAGSMGKGLFRYDPGTDSFVPIRYASDLPVKKLYPAGPNEIYIGTDGNGMKVYDVQRGVIREGNFNITAFDPVKSKIHSIAKDRNGNIWLGFFQKGAMVLPSTNNAFGYVGHKSALRNSIGSNCVISVCKDHTGTLWVGTDNDGIYGINAAGEQIAHYSRSTDPRSVPATVMSIFEDSDHNLWIGSYLHGMARFDPRTGRCEYQYGLQDGKSNYVQRVYCFAEDDTGRLWIGTMGAGLFYMDRDSGEITRCDSPEDGTRYREDANVVPNQWINCLLQTSDGKLYIGTCDGLGCLDTKTMDFVLPYGKNRMLGGTVVSCLYEDSGGHIWIGTGQGLMRLDPETATFGKYTEKEGLPGNTICAIRGDDTRNLWISTNGGISKFNPETNNFINYYASDGLQGNEFSKNASYKGADGEIIFGGINGITRFYPEAITNTSKKPEIRITDFYIHDRPVRKGMKSKRREITDAPVTETEVFSLSHRDNSFSIEFSAMEFITPERITYQYTLDGDRWITLHPGINRVSFGNLASGIHHFRVRAKDYAAYSDNREITIDIAPAWYASEWARTAYALLALSIAVLTAALLRHRCRIRRRMLEHRHAEQINEAKLQFFTNISHEIRTPISLITGPLEKLMATDEDKERQRNYGIMYRNAKRILRLINQLMDIRKIDRGQMALKFRETDIAGFVGELCSTFEYQAAEKHVGLHFHTPEKKIMAWIAPEHFDKVIVNILSNAFRFTPEGGRIDIYLHTRAETAETGTPPHYCEIVVEDTGTGINEKEIGRIFERFYQTRDGQHNPNGGTGVGLHLTRLLAELHHGTVHAENNPGKSGCRFIVRLPLGKEHLKPEEIEEYPLESRISTHGGPADKTSPENIKSKTRYRVLVVEDDEEIRRYICSELGDTFHTFESTNGKDALEKILKKAPDLVISDVMMPEMDGFTLCRKIRQNVNINHVPVILLTARSGEEDNMEGLETGADAYLTKPFSTEILKKTVSNIIRSREILRNNFSGQQEQKDKIRKIEAKSPDDRLLERVMAVIDANLGNPEMNVTTIASKVGISRVHLHRKMKELTNQSTRDLIRNIRLKQAAALLAEKRHNITDVATLTGFTNLAYFSTAFRELYGVSPTAYMKGNTNGTKGTDEPGKNT